MSHQITQPMPTIAAHQCRVQYHEGFALVVKCDKCKAQWRIDPITGKVENIVAGQEGATHTARISGGKVTEL